MSHDTEGGVFAVVETWLGSVGRTPLEAARQLGLRTAFVTDGVGRYTTNAADRAAFAACVDEVIEADTRSGAAVADALAAHHRAGRLRGVFSTNDYSVPTTAEAARLLGLPGLAPEAAHRARNKLRTREACDRAGVPGPAWQWARSEAQALAAGDRVGYPCVVKPMTDAGSIGVRLCRTPGQLAEHYRAIASVPTDYRGGPRTPGALVEEYLVGFEVSVETVTVDGGRTVLGVTDKVLGPHPHFVEVGQAFPSVLPEGVRGACTATALAALDALGHDFGAAHVEVKLTADGPRLVEVNARMPGARITRLIRESTGVHLQRELVELHTGGRPDLAVRHRRGAASRCLTAADGGTVRAVRGEDLARRVPGLVALDLYVRPGDAVRRAQDNVDVCGSLVAVGDTAGEAVRRADAAMGQLSVDVEAAP
ncbi:ATP-grasp domain-containing protein [Kitasatospora sp. NPDC001660]